MSETKLKAKAIQYIKKTYPTAFIYKTADKFTAGIPDILICLNGKFIAIELKTPTGKVSAIQKWTIQKINESGGFACVCRSLEDVKNALR